MNRRAITITTDGGFTGRGLGNVTVDEDVDERVRAAVANARPESWQREYTTRGADLINYTLTLGDCTTSWQTRAEIPEDLQELFEAVWVHK
jgi:hypothetical protein